MSQNNLYGDKQLLLQIAEGNEQAFAHFIYSHTDALYSYILKITKSEPWAEELVQDVWMQVWHARESFALLENPIGYLYRMAQHRSLDWIRRNKRELKVQYTLEQHLHVRDPQAITSTSDYNYTKQLLQQAIDQLPPQRKLIFELKQAGYSYEEIASKLNISKNTVRNQMVSALQSLREYLQQHGEALLLFLYFFSG